MKRPHDYFTSDEWDDLERVTKRWSEAGRARENINYPASGETILAVYAEDRDAAEDYRRTIDRILTALRARAPKVKP